MIHLPILTLSLLLFPISLNAVKDTNKKILKPRSIKRAIKKEPCTKKNQRNKNIIVSWQGSEWYLKQSKKGSSNVSLHKVDDPNIKIVLDYTSEEISLQDFFVNDFGNLELGGHDVYWTASGKRLFCNNKIKLKPYPDQENDELSSMFIPLLENEPNTDNSNRAPWFKSRGRYEYVNNENFYDLQEKLPEIFPELNEQSYLNFDQQS